MISCDITRYSRSLSTIWNDLVRADAFWYVYQEQIRFVVSDYDFWKDFDHDLYHDLTAIGILTSKLPMDLSLF